MYYLFIQIETKKRGISDKEKIILEDTYNMHVEESEPIKRKHRPAGPNPLSCLKKRKIEKTEPIVKTEDNSEKKRTRRGKKKIKQLEKDIKE